MKTSELIKKMCEQHNISIAELARKIGQSPQNFGKKLKRNTISHSELIQIADVFGVTYEQTFSSNNEEVSSVDIGEMANKFITDEFGLRVYPVEDNSENMDENYVRLDSDAFSKISSLLHNLPHYVTEIRAEKLSTGTYKVIYDKGLGQLQQSAKNRERFRANVVAFGTNNDITGQAELENFQLKVFTPTLAIFDIAAIATNQYYLARIDNKLGSLDSKLDYVQKFLEENKKSYLWANGQFLKDVSNKVYEITSDDQYRLATLTNVVGIRKDALANVKFYHNMIQNFITKEFDENQKDYSDTKATLEHFFEHFDAYLYSIYVYGFAYVVEVTLSQITEEVLLRKIKGEILNIIEEFQADYAKYAHEFLDKVKSLNPGLLTETFSGKTPTYSACNNSGVSLFLETALLLANFAANHDKKKKKAQKDEVEELLRFCQKRTDEGIKDLDIPIHAIEHLNEIYNTPVEMLLTNEAVFMKVSSQNAKTGSDVRNEESEME